MIEQLVQIGFNEREARVYMAVLELGKSSIAPLVGRSGVSKKLAYKALKWLMAEGYVVAEGRRKKVFAVTDVELIGMKLKEKVRAFHEIVPQLYASASVTQHDRSLNIFTGEQLVRNMLKQQMRKEPRGSVFLCIESAGFNFVNFMKGGKYGVDFDIYERNRLNRNIQVRVLFVHQQSEPIVIKYRRTKREIRSLLSSFSNSIAGMYIWHDRVFIVNWKPDEMTLVELISKDIRLGFSSYFDSLWQHGHLELLER